MNRLITAPGPRSHVRAGRRSGSGAAQETAGLGTRGARLTLPWPARLWLSLDIQMSHPHFQQLKDKIERNSALVGVIGLGYVGLPLAHALHKGGLAVLGFDVDPGKIEALAAGRNYLAHLGDEMARELAGGRFSATTDFARLGECDVVIVCVPTPLGEHQEP